MTIKKQCFMVGQVVEYVINNMRGEMDFSITVLRSKDVKRKKGVIDFYYMHSLFGDDYERIDL